MSLTPILLSSSGRSGSTLMMRLLSSHPQIVGRTLFPYETRASQYYFACTRMGHATPPGGQITYLNVGYLPFQGNDDRSNQWFARNKAYHIVDGGQNLAQPYYEFVGQLEGKQAPTHYVEKSVGWQLMEQMAAEIPAMKMILLVRDPRDIFFSIKSFNEKRGTPKQGFGEEMGDEKMFSNLINYPKAFARVAQEMPDRVVNIRYEEIVTAPHAALLSLFNTLGLSTSEEQLNAIVTHGFSQDSNVKEHRTTEDDVSTSVGRWKHNADAAMVEFFGRFREDLQHAGYE